MMKFAPIFTDHTVLQREKPLHLWGTGSPDTTVTVSLGSLSGTARVQDGKWEVTLPPLPAGGPYTMTLTDGEEMLTLEDIMLGEVWLCGGQSNMELVMRDSKDPVPALAASADSHVRLYHVCKRGIFDEEFYAEENASCWQLPCRDTVQHWTAIGYYFGAELAKKQGVTVGLVECNYGGTSASAWISEEKLAQTAIGQKYLDDYTKGMEGLTDEEGCRAYLKYCEYHNAWQKRIEECYRDHPGISWKQALEICGENRYPGPQAPNNPLRAHGLYDTMISRIVPYTMRGVLYYQGESDDHRPEGYQTLLTTLIRQWREDFRDQNLPFLLVQLPMYAEEETIACDHWCRIRQAQELVYRNVRHTGLACILDCGEYLEIHPKEKKIPAHRLFLQAMREVYHLQENGTTSPIVREAYRTEGGIRVLFDNVDNGLMLRGEGGFCVQDTDGMWYPAKATVNEESVFVRSDEVKAPVGVRYGWVNYGEVTFFEQNGLPVFPFRIEKL